jgi:hypothetical protein
MVLVQTHRDAHSRSIGLHTLVIGAALALAAAVLFVFDPSRYPIYPTCILHKLTGLLCPGCGSLRALHQLLHGHLAAALHFNALLVVSLLPLAAWGAWRARRNRRHPSGAPGLRPVWLWCALGLLLAFGVLRNLPFAQAAWLAP